MCGVAVLRMYVSGPRAMKKYSIQYITNILHIAIVYISNIFLEIYGNIFFIALAVCTWYVYMYWLYTV